MQEYLIRCFLDATMFINSNEIREIEYSTKTYHNNYVATMRNIYKGLESCGVKISIDDSLASFKIKKPDFYGNY